MKKEYCEIIRDLLPLYVDKVASEGSKKMVERHLALCESCREQCRQMSDTLELPSDSGIHFLQTCHRKLRNKRFWTAVISVVATIGILMGLYSAAVLIRTPITYDSELIRVSQNQDGDIVSSYRGNNLAYSYGYLRLMTLDSGEKVWVAGVLYEQSFYSKYLEPIWKKDSETYLFPLVGKEQQEQRDQYPIRVYYLNDTSVYDQITGLSLEDEEVIKILEEKAQLIWEQ